MPKAQENAGEAKVQTEGEQKAQAVIAPTGYWQGVGTHATKRGIDAVAAVGAGAALMGCFNLIVRD